MTYSTHHELVRSPLCDDDEALQTRFEDLDEAEQKRAILDFVREVDDGYLFDAFSELKTEELLAAFESGDAALGALIRREITAFIGDAIDRAVNDGRFVL